MAEQFKRQFLEFEQPIKELYEQVEDSKRLAARNNKINYEPIIAKLEENILAKRKELTEHLTPWQKVQLSRHPDRPYTLEYISKVFTDFIELHGDRNVKDDKAMVGGHRTGLEPATSAVTGRHSNQLNYRSNKILILFFVRGAQDSKF